MYTSCLNYGRPEKGHRANGFTTDGGFAEYAVNHINTLARVPDTMSDAEATRWSPPGPRCTASPNWAGWLPAKALS